MPVSIFRRLILAVLCSAFAASAALATGESDPLAEAHKLLRAGQHQQALEVCNRILAQKPGDPQARFLKGLIFTDEGNSSAAIEMFQKLTVDYPELPEPYNNLAVIYASQGQYEKARVALEKSIRTHPSYATAYENLGDVYAKLASQAYDRALKLDSSNEGAQNKLALVRDLIGGLPNSTTSALAVAVAPKPAPQAKPAIKPEAKPAPAPTAAGSTEGALEAVQAWAQAWSRKDVDAYLGSYSKDFHPPHGASRNDWEKQRRERVSSPKHIAVKLENLRVTPKAGGRASVTFRQDYAADTFSGRSNKTLLLGKSEDGRWRILQEQVSN
ncbi:MAG: L,D-transpeptidase Cds6 family protein [Burkholderiales bacterium]